MQYLSKVARAQIHEISSREHTTHNILNLLGNMLPNLNYPIIVITKKLENTDCDTKWPGKTESAKPGGGVLVAI